MQWRAHSHDGNDRRRAHIDPGRHLVLESTSSHGSPLFSKQSTSICCSAVGSLFRQGLMVYEHIPNWPEHRLRPLIEKFAQNLMEQRPYREIFGVI